MSSGLPIGLLLVDDDPLIRAGLGTILASDPGLKILGEAENGLRAIELASRLQPEVIMMDIRMPQLDGLGAMERILAESATAKVLILTTFGEEEYIDGAMSVGAAGFMLKSSDPEELIRGVYSVADGAAALSPRIAKRLVDKFRSVDHDRRARAMGLIEQLTPREHDVLALVGAGNSNSEIADVLVLTPATVKGHMTSILIKLKVRNRVEAALIAYQGGLVD